MIPGSGPQRRLEQLLHHLAQSSENPTIHPLTQLYLEINIALEKNDPSAIQKAVKEWEKKNVTAVDLQMIQDDFAKHPELQKLSTRIQTFFQKHLSGNDTPIRDSALLSELIEKNQLTHIQLLFAMWSESRIKNAVDENDNNILHMIVESGNYDLLRSILRLLTPEQQKELLHAKNKNGKTPFQIANHGNYLSLFQILIHAGIDPNHVQTSEGNNILHMVGQTNDCTLMFSILKLLTTEQKKELLHAKNQKGETPLLCACRTGNADMFRILINEGANLNDVDNDGNSIFHKIAQSGNSDLMEYVINPSIIVQIRKTLLHAKNKDGDTPLLLACRFNDPHKGTMFRTLENLKMLITTGAHLDDVDKEGNTALHLLALSEKLDDCLFLLSNSSQKQKEYFVKCTNKSGFTFWEILLHNPYPYVRQPLLELFNTIPTSQDPILGLVLRLLKENKLSILSDFLKTIEYKLVLLSSDPSIRQQVLTLFSTFIHHYEEIKEILYELRINPELALQAENLPKMAAIYQKYKNTPHKNHVLIAFQTCKDITLLTHAVEALALPSIEDEKTFLSLSSEQQELVMARFVVFRDRKGLAIVSSLLQQRSQNLPNFTKLISYALQLIEKIQILSHPTKDEDALLSLIWALLSQQETNPTVLPVLSQAILTFAKVDKIRLHQQYKNGIFQIFSYARERGSTPLLLTCLRSLRSYSYDALHDKEMIEELINLSKTPSLSLEIQRELGLLLSTIPDEKALLSAWDIIQGPAWDHYKEWSKAHEYLHMGNFDLFTFHPSALHENRENMRIKILDLLGELNKKEYASQIEKRWMGFQKNPSAYPQLQKFQTKLKNLPKSGIRYIDPLYLPDGSVVFRGISSRKGEGRAHDALIDLFVRGIGDSELTGASSSQGTWAKVGQFFLALDIDYAKGYIDQSGAFIVVDGNYINQTILQGRARQQKEAGSMHYVLYDTINHEHIKAIYIDPQLKAELTRLKNADLNDLPSDLFYFSNLTEKELKEFVVALQHDPHNIFSKLQAAELTGHFKPKEYETPFALVVEENLKREILRELMQEKYAKNFERSQLRSKL